jgi:hypothetical protein
MRLNAQQIAGYAKAAGFPPGEIATATAVALAESAGETTATNKNSNNSVDYGLWQINTVHGQLLNQGDKFNPLDNARMALTVWQRAGNKWTPWTVYKSGAYRAQMGAGTMGAAAPTDPQETVGTPGDTSTVPAGTTVASSPLDLLGPIGTALGGILGSFNRLTSGALWLRVGAFMLGSWLIILSLLRLTGTDKLVAGSVKTAAKVYTRGVVG